MLNRPRSQHYVPVFYLRRWCADRKKLWVYERTDSGVTEMNVCPEDTACEDWLYSFGQEFPWEHLQNPDIIETDIFGEIDNDAAKIMDLVVSRKIKSLSKTQKKKWIRFVVSLVERNLRTLKTSDELFHEFAKKRVEFLVANARDPEAFAACLEGMNLQEVTRSIVRREMVKAIKSRQVRDRLWDMNLLTVGFEEDCLVTCDEPVRVNFGAEATWLQTLALATSPRHLFVFVPKGTGALASHHGVKLAEAYVNAVMLSKARLIYAHRPLGEWYPLLRHGLEKYFGTGEHPGFTTFSIESPP